MEINQRGVAYFQAHTSCYDKSLKATATEVEEIKYFCKNTYFKFLRKTFHFGKIKIK